jgi:hypothetical protein
VTDRTQLQEQTRPLWPGRARRAREAPMAALQSTRRRPSHPQQETSHQPPGAHREATPGPPKPRRAKKNPDLGQDSGAAGLDVAPPPRGRATATTSPGAAATREESSRHRNQVHRGAPPPAQSARTPPASRTGRSMSAAAGTARGFARRPAPTAAKGGEGEEEPGG